MHRSVRKGSLSGTFILTEMRQAYGPLAHGYHSISFLRIAKIGREARSSGDEGLQLAGHLLEVSCRTSDEFLPCPADNLISL